MNQFGGNWTDQKMDIVVGYAKAYLTIMKEQKWAKTIYFDGFAGSGSIEQNVSDDASNSKSLFRSVPLVPATPTEAKESMKKGTALRILDIVDPKPFDIYYFVEKDENHYNALLNLVQTNYPDRKTFVVREDCNQKLLDMATFLKNNKDHRVLAFIDPYGMSVKWSSIESLVGLGIDLWILVPTGLGANRVLVNDGKIPESWLQTLEVFLGISKNEITKLFYRQQTSLSNLFGEDVSGQNLKKNCDTVNKLGKLYSSKLKGVFKYVSDPFVMRNSKNSIMYHFMMATNNKSALKIANDVIKPIYKL